MFSVLYFVQGKITVYVENETIEVNDDTIVIIKSRKMQYEIKETAKSKLFIIRYWVCGPPDETNNA